MPIISFFSPININNYNNIQSCFNLRTFQSETVADERHELSRGCHRRGTQINSHTVIYKSFPTLISQEPLARRLQQGSSKNVSVERLRRDLRDESFKFAELDQAGNLWCKENHYAGYTSYGSLADIYNYSSTFADLEACLRPFVGKFIRALRYEVTMKDLEINSMWINLMPHEGHHASHIHPLSIISGTYYVQIPREAQSIKFEDPRLSNYMNQPLKKKLPRQNSPYHVEILPQTNDVILFESWLRHEVVRKDPRVLKKEQTRISISFNYGWKNQGSGSRGSSANRNRHSFSESN